MACISMTYPSLFSIYLLFIVLLVSITKYEAEVGEKDEGAAGFLLNNATTTIPSCWDTT